MLCSRSIFRSPRADPKWCAGGVPADLCLRRGNNRGRGSESLILDKSGNRVIRAAHIHSLRTFRQTCAMPLDLLDLILASLVMALGSAIQAAVGYGIALVVVPLLALIDPRLIPGPMLFAAVVLAGIMAYRGRAAIVAKEVALSQAGLIVGTALGAFALTLVDPEDLPRIFGVLILLAVAASASGFHPAVTNLSLSIGGFLGGFMGIMSGIHGPPVALLYQKSPGAKVRAMMGMFFLIGYPIAIVSLFLVGLFNRESLVMGLLLIPGVCLGYLVNPLLARFLDRGFLRPAILLVATVSALSLFFKG